MAFCYAVIRDNYAACSIDKWRRKSLHFHLLSLIKGTYYMPIDIGQINTCVPSNALIV